MNFPKLQNSKFPFPTSSKREFDPYARIHINDSLNFLRRFVKLEQDRNRWRNNNIRSVKRLLGHMILNSLTSLENTSDSISHFSQSKLLTNADSRASIKWNITKLYQQMFKQDCNITHVQTL